MGKERTASGGAEVRFVCLAGRFALRQQRPQHDQRVAAQERAESGDMQGIQKAVAGGCGGEPWEGAPPLWQHGAEVIEFGGSVSEH